MSEERIKDGLYREFGIAVCEIIKSRRTRESRFDIGNIGREVVMLHSEFFDQD